MLTLDRMAKARRAEVREIRRSHPEIAALYTGDVYDEEVLPQMLTEMGVRFDGGLLKESIDCYGVLPGEPKPPREEGGALPGLALTHWGENGSWYVKASRAWMHANCATHPLERVVWLNVLDLYRQDKEPKWLPIDGRWPSQHPKAVKLPEGMPMPWEKKDPSQGMQLPWTP